MPALLRLATGAEYPKPALKDKLSLRPPDAAGHFSSHGEVRTVEDTAENDLDKCVRSIAAC